MRNIESIGKIEEAFKAEFVGWDVRPGLDYILLEKASYIVNAQIDLLERMSAPPPVESPEILRIIYREVVPWREAEALWEHGLIGSKRFDCDEGLRRKVEDTRASMGW